MSLVGAVDAALGHPVLRLYWTLTFAWWSLRWLAWPGFQVWVTARKKHGWERDPIAEYSRVMNLHHTMRHAIAAYCQAWYGEIPKRVCVLAQEEQSSTKVTQFFFDPSDPEPHNDNLKARSAMADIRAARDGRCKP